MTDERVGPKGRDEIVRAYRESFPEESLIVVSNREPYEHRWGEDVGEIRVKRPAGGLTSALDPLLQTVGGVWIAWGSGDADAAVVDEDDRIRVPPEDPKYTLRRLWLDQHDVNRYYLGYANQFLWPICHYRPALTRVRARYWERYRRVNRRFAEAVLDEARSSAAAVWVQDYHLALAPGFVRARRPDLSLAHFWHIPWPPVEIFEVTPQAEALIRGLLANDLMGFQLPSHRSNFLRCAQALVGAEVDWQNHTASIDGHTCHVRDFPISIDTAAFTAAATVPDAEAAVARLRERYCPDGGQLGVGIDRMDYSKGLPEKLKALDLLFERYPEYHGRFTFVQVGVPSRTDIEAYDELTQKVERLVWEINDRYRTPDWQPVHLIKQSLPAERLAILYRAADVCIVASLRDGMNLVAKEFIACQADERGVLLLSKFAGAALELEHALQVNPYDPEDFASILHDALRLGPEERAERIRAARAGMRSIYDWMADIFEEWGRIRRSADLPAGTDARAPASSES
jgi:alpha,alpha-trehalose-phosphate synthase [UDP-forming]